MTSIEEAIRSGAVRLVPVEATPLMNGNGDLAISHRDMENCLKHGIGLPIGAAYRAMVETCPDHTPALLALIEERHRLKVERDGHLCAIQALAAVIRRQRKTLKALHRCHDRDQKVTHGFIVGLQNCRGEKRAAEARALAAEAASASKDERIAALEKALEPFGRAAGYHALQSAADDAQVIIEVKPGLSGALEVGDFRRARALTQETADVGE